MKELKETDNKPMGAARNKEGQTMVEWALVAVFIAIVLVFVFRTSGLNQGMSTAASRVNSTLLTPP